MPIVENIEKIDGKDFTMIIEVDKEPEAESPYRDLRNGDKALAKTSELFDKGMVLARNCAKKVVQNMKEMGNAVKPDEFQLQFAVKLDTEVGAVLAKAGTEAQLQVTMTWKSEGKKS
jgi:exonuclease VII small subunit